MTNEELAELIEELRLSLEMQISELSKRISKLEGDVEQLRNANARLMLMI